MTMCNLKKQIFVFVYALFAMSAAAGVYDDVTTWWHFDYDANGDGVVQTDEVRDQLFWGTAAAVSTNGAVCTSRSGPSGGPTWTNITVTAPAGGVNYGGMSMEFSPLTNAANAVYPDGLKFSQYNKVDGSCTLVTRLYSKGAVCTAENSCWLFSNNFNWGGSSGWLFGYRAGATPQIGMYTRTSSTFYQNNHVFQFNTWYDIAAVLTDNGATGDTVEFYVWPQGGRLTYYKKTFTVDVFKEVPLYNGGYIGGEYLSSSYATSSARKCFNGFINHLALWNRALTEEEVMDAFSYPNQAMQIGLDNDDDSEFGDSAVTTASISEGDPWHTFDCTASSADPVEVVFPLNNLHIHQPNLNQILVADVFEAGSAGDSASIALVVNGITNITLSATAGKKLKWFVDGSLLVTGDNTLKLVYLGGTASSVSFDTLFLGGSWIVGKIDGSPAEFTQEDKNTPDDFYFFDPDWKHVQRAITPGVTNLIARFWVPEEVASRGDYVYSTKIISQGGEDVPHPFIIWLNDEVIYADPAGVPNNTPVAVDIPFDDMVAGENTIKFQFDLANHTGASAWMQFDYHRLEIQDFVMGTLILIK